MTTRKIHSNETMRNAAAVIVTVENDAVVRLARYQEQRLKIEQRIEDLQTEIRRRQSELKYLADHEMQALASDEAATTSATNQFFQAARREFPGEPSEFYEQLFSDAFSVRKGERQ